MNHIYKLKFDKRRNEIVVVSEITTGPGKVHTSRGTKKNVVSMVNNLARSVLSVLILAGLGSPALAAGLPVGGQVVAGSASIQKPTENQMNIHQNSAHAVLNWNSFDIGQGHTVQFYQPDSSAVALNRVVGGNESHIMGNLNANGRVFLVNPNGVLFGKGASVNTAGLVATTRDIKNEDFMNGKYVFSGQKGQGEVVNQGNLTTTKGGFIVLAGDRVRNSGTIRTPEGRAVLAAAEKVTLQLDNAGLTSVAVNGSVVNALVENSGLVSASDGQVLLTARGKNMLMNTVLNNSGVVEAQGLSVKDGNIVLDGGDSGVVQHSGTLMADNNRGRGGKVVVEGQHILLDEHSRITATGRQGGGEVYVGGGWQGKDTGIRHAQKVVMLKGANIDVSATEKGNGGTAVLWSDEYTRFHGNIQAKGGQTSGNGGQVETSSHNNLQAFGQVDASAATGRGGEWLLDPADITIVDNGTNTNVTNSTTNSTSVFTPDANATTGQVGVTNINNLLNNGTSVNITTSNGTTGNGSITVNAVINKTSGADATLTLFADGNITVNKNITSSNGALNVNLFGANSRDGAVNISRSNITTNNGNLTISHGSGHNMTVAITNNTTISAGTGNISIDGQSNNKSVQAVNITGSTLNASSIMLNGTALADTAGVKVNNSTLNASQNITMTANSAYRGVLLQGANISANSINIAAEGRTANAAVWVEKANSQNTTLNASSLTMTGNTSTGQAYGLYLTNMTLLGNIADFQNTTLSSAGSAGTNTIGAGVITTDTALKNVLTNGIENDTTVNLSAVNNSSAVNTTTHAVNLSGLSQLLSGSVGRDGNGDVTVNLAGNKSGGWNFSSGVEDLSTTGNIALSGLLNPGNLTSTAGSILVNGGELLLANLSLSAAKDVTLNGRSVTLNGTSVTSTNGNVNITGNNTLGSGHNMTVAITNNTTISAGTGNISIDGQSNNKSVQAVNITGSTLNASSIMLNGTALADTAGVKVNNSTLNASQNITMTANSAYRGVLLQGANISANSINIAAEGRTANAAVLIEANTSITGTNDIRLEGSRVEVRNANITAGNFSVNATTRGFEISNATVNATDNITLTATTTGSNASGVYLKDANLSSTNGSIIGTGTATAGSVAVHLDNNVTLNASQGDITLTGSSDTGSGVVIRNATLNASIGDIALNGAVNSTYVATGDYQRYGGGVVLTGDNNFDGKNINVNGSAQSGDTRVAGVVFHNNVESNLNVSGNLSIQGDGNNVAGVNVVYRDVNINMASGALNINGVSTNSSGVFFSGVHGQYATTKLNVNLNNSDFTLSGNGGSGGVTGYTYQNQFISGISVQGKGNVTITGNSTDNDGVALHRLDNSNLTGMLKVDGFSENGNGVVASLNSDWHLQNAVITGTSEYGNGITIHAPKGVYSPNIDLGNTTLTGTTVNGSAGVNIDGDNVKLTNGSISGVASSQGGGVSLTGGSNYSVSGVNVTGSSANGTGISVNGSLEVGGNSTLNGTSTGNGTGVQIGGNLTSNGGASITGTASSGDGVQVSGNVEATGGNVSVTGNSDSGSGVNIQGNTSLENTMVTGSTQTGTGVNISGNLTNTGSSSVTGTSQQGGTGVDLGGNVSGGSVTGSSATGSGVTVSGSSTTINNVAVSGSTQSGSGVTVTGNLTNGGSSTVSGSASGNGSGVTLAGNVSGGSLSGYSHDGEGVNVSGNSQINGVALQASTTNGVALAVQNNVTLGQQGSTVSTTVTEGGRGHTQSGGNSPEGQLIRAGNEWQSVYYQSGKQAYGNRLMEAGAKAEAQADIELCLDDGECRKESLAVTQVGDKGQQGARK